MGALISAFFGLITITVGLRFIFRLFGANPSTPFVSLVYNISAPLVAPFAGIFGQNTTIDPAIGAVFEWTSLIALVVYALIAAVISRATAGYGHRI